MSTLTDAEILTQTRELTAILGAEAEYVFRMSAAWQMQHGSDPLAIAVPERFAPEVVNGAIFLGWPLVRSTVSRPTLLVPATP